MPVSLRNLLWSMLFHYRYRVMTESDGGLDACTDDPAIQQSVVVTRRCCLYRRCLSYDGTQAGGMRVTPTLV